MSRTTCPRCHGIGCTRCEGLGWIDASETTLSGSGSEVEQQLSPEDHARITAAFEAMRRKIIREQRIAAVWGWSFFVLGLAVFTAVVFEIALACGWRP